MPLSAHLCFDGQCEEAFQTYARILGGTIETMLSYGEAPMGDQVEPQWRKRIVHATLEWNGNRLLGADVLGGAYERPQGFFLTLSVDDLEKATFLFESLVEGGRVLMPLQATFWSPAFGVLVDRFGVPWEINCEGSPN
jgi:PhnB protein